MANNPAIAQRVVGFRRALHVALAALRRRPGGLPSVVVLCLEGFHRLQLDYDSDDAAASSGNDATGTISEDSWAVLRQLVVESDSIDVVLLSSVPIPERFSRPTTVQAWSGHHTLIVPGKSMGGAFLPYAKGGGGFYALNVTLALDANGRLLPNSSTAAAALLDCVAPSDSGVRSRMLQWHGLMDAQLGDAQCPMSNAHSTAHCPMPNAQCPMPNALCPMPNALCPMPFARCQMAKPIPQRPMPSARCPTPNALNAQSPYLPGVCVSYIARHRTAGRRAKPLAVHCVP